MMQSVDIAQWDSVIGIDPDLVKSGIAIWTDGELVELKMMALLPLFNFLQTDEAKDILFVLEDVEANKPVFRRAKQNQSQMNRIAQNVGMVKGVARQIKLALEHVGVDFVMVPPLKGVLKQTKNNPKLFKQLTGWAGQSNQDKRDAAMLPLYLKRGGRAQVFLQEAA